MAEATDDGDIIERQTVKIFQELPAKPDATVFAQGILVKDASGQRQAMVLYAPNLQNIGCVDNTKSSASATYTKSVANGFTFSTSTTLSIEAAAEVSIEVVKASLKVGFSITFTQQYSTLTTETLSFSVPAGKKAFLYQGYLLAAPLTQDTGSGSYTYTSNKVRFLTNVLASSPEPVTGAANFQHV